MACSCGMKGAEDECLASSQRCRRRRSVVDRKVGPGLSFNRLGWIPFNDCNSGFCIRLCPVLDRGGSEVGNGTLEAWDTRCASNTTSVSTLAVVAQTHHDVKASISLKCGLGLLKSSTLMSELYPGGEYLIVQVTASGFWIKSQFGISSKVHLISLAPSQPASNPASSQASARGHHRCP
jgi:hypothetical protein